MAMVYGETGYLRPASEHPLSAEERKQLYDMCPGVNLVREPAEDGVYDDPVWGPMIGLYTGHSTDDAIRYQASSGGGLSAVLIHLFESGEVHFVLHTCVSDEHPLKNVTGCSRTREEILAGAGSRYSPSSPLAGIAR
jgi:coenzyme F420 hydrogenase subunit beta